MQEALLWDFEKTREMINKSTWGLRWLIRTRAIPIVRIGRKIYFDPEDLKKWIEENKIKEFNKEGEE